MQYQNAVYIIQDWQLQGSSHPTIFWNKINFFLYNIGVDEREGIDKKQQKMAQEREACSLKVIFLMQIHICTFFFNSIFPSQFLLQYYSEKQEKHIKEHISVSEITIFYNSTNIINRRILQLHYFVNMGCLHNHLCLKMQMYLKQFLMLTCFNMLTLILKILLIG